MATLKFKLLGPLEAELDSRPVDLGTPKQKAVLALLLLNANTVVPTEKIIDSVWGETPPRTADHSVQIYVSQLRKVLTNGAATSVIETRAPGYILNTPVESIDAVQFERLVEEGLSAARTGDTSRGQRLLERALTAWRAQPLADFVYEEFAQPHIRRLSDRHADAAETLASIALDQGENEEARALASHAIEADPLREEPHRLMMLALYRASRQAEALREFGRYKELLGEQLGLEPSHELQDLEERILLQDPTLAADSLVVAADGNPYRGLRAFSEDDADLYFGREDLVDEVLDRLRDGHGFVSIVGPSGSGKSSAAQAGAMPILRRSGDTVVVFQPGARPLWELASALDQAGFGSRASLHRRFETEPDSLAELVDRPVTIVIDQFEEVFTLADTEEANQLGQLMARAIRDPRCRLRAITTLRADYYDRPLSMPELAGPFAEATVGVKPMTAQGIERAVVEPARAAGRQVEPALLAQLVADMVDEPGALPLLQFTLFELYERSDGPLTLDGYQEIGGLHGALARGAEETLEELDEEGQEIAEQLFMRMVRKGRSVPTSRPAPLREVLDLGDDRVALQAVLEAFGSRRLLTFSRDASGAAVVEIAHEYLISEWPQLGEWIEAHSEDLDHLVVLDAAAAQWEEHDRSEDYLLRGGRLAEAKAWVETSTLRFTGGERAYLGASVDLKEREEAVRREREEREAGLARSARRRLWAFAGALVALAAAVTFLVISLTPEPPPDVIVVDWGPGDGSFGDMVFAAIEYGRDELGLEIDLIRPDVATDEVLRDAMDRGTGLVMVTFGDSPGIVENYAGDYPEVLFVVLDCADGDLAENAACVVAADDEMSFLGGVAAASATETDRVGAVAGVDFFDSESGWRLFDEFVSGFRQGVSWVDETVEVDVVHLSGWDGLMFDAKSGFSSYTLGSWGAEILYARGSDVVYNMAGQAGWGIPVGALHHEDITGEFVWFVGVDADQYTGLDSSELGLGDEGFKDLIRERILTSVVKHLDVAAIAALEQYAATGTVDDFVLTVENGGVDYSTSGGHIDPYIELMDAAKQAIISGEVVIEVEPQEDIVYLRDLLDIGG